ADDGAIGVAGGPRIGEQLAALALEARVQLSGEPVERLAQRRPPALLRRPLGGHPAAAVRPPAFHPVRAAPRRGRYQLHLVLRRVSRQEGGEVFDPPLAAPLE